MTEYMFIITGQFALPNGDTKAFTASGDYKVPPGMTRRAAFMDIVAYAKRQRGIADDVFVAVLFFAFEPNRLGGA